MVLLVNVFNGFGKPHTVGKNSSFFLILEPDALNVCSWPISLSNDD